MEKQKTKKTMPYWALILILAGCFSIVTAAVHLYWTTVTIPFEVTGIELSAYPEVIMQDPGENVTYSCNVTNTVDRTYNITLVFALDDTEYFDAYVTVNAMDFYTIAPLSTTKIEFEVCISLAAYPVSGLEFTIDFYIVPE